MNKFKHRIYKNRLSWENNTKFHLCDYVDCNMNGEYRAPKSRIKINEYYLFCLKHVKEYNKSWDFYKGLNVDQIELSIRKDTIWNRPSWPLNGSPQNIISQISEFLKNDYSLFENDRDYEKFLRNKIDDEKLTEEEYKSLKIMNLSLPITVEEIKKSYKKLVKIFHPDVNDNDKEAENNFKEINLAYKMLLKKFLNKKND